MMGSLLGRGTSNITKDEFNEKVDFLGANVSFFSSGASARSLKKYFPEVLGLMADGVKNSQFTQEEFDKEKKVTLESLKTKRKTFLPSQEESKIFSVWKKPSLWRVYKQRNCKQYYVRRCKK